MKKIIVILVFLFIGIPSLVAHSAQQPLDALQGPIDQVIAILNDPQYQDVTHKDLERQKIWKIIRELFDFTEMAKRSLARNWRTFTPEQRKRFSGIFAEFLGNTYLDKMQKGYQNERVIYMKQEMVTDSKALVKTKILRENLEMPVNYSMRMRKGTWKVYDVNIEGVSLVKNYRTQFGKILLKKTPDQLIERLKEKVKKQRKVKLISEKAALWQTDWVHS